MLTESKKLEHEEDKWFKEHEQELIEAAKTKRIMLYAMP